MEKTVARYVANTAFRSWSEMADLVPWLNEHCEPAECKEIAKAIATACAEVILEVQHRIYALYPELDRERSEIINKYEALI